MEGIKARIRIRNMREKDIAYIYDINALRNLFPNRNMNSYEEKFLNPFEIDPDNSVIELNEEKYKILYINTKFANITFDANGIGISPYGIGQDHPFNFQITYIVEHLEKL